MDAYSFAGSQDGTVQIVSSGTSIFPKRQSSVFVKSESMPADAKVHITFTQNFTPATAYWVSEAKAGEGFELRVDTPLYYDTSFSWWISK